MRPLGLYFLFGVCVCMMVPTSCQELTSTLRSTPDGQKFAYPGENVTFVCITTPRGDFGNTLGWSSDEYIGSDGNRLEFVSIESQGTTRTAGQTVARLDGVSSGPGGVTLVSHLSIQVQSLSSDQVASITCHDVGNEVTDTISFIAIDDAFVTCNKQSACPGETVQCTCMTAQSTGLAWSSDQLIGRDGSQLDFSSSQNLQMRKDSSISNTFAVLTGSFVSNGVSLLESRITFTTSVPTDITLTCFNVDRGKSDNVTIPTSRTCGSTSSAITAESTTELNIIRNSSDNGGAIVALAIVCFILAVALCIVIILWLRSLLHLKKKKDRQILKVKAELEKNIKSKLLSCEPRPGPQDLVTAVAEINKKLDNIRQGNLQMQG